ncbi:MAG: nucleoside hydrolase [Lentisphaerae bacterium]|nr:nucleoside hydrolase [Lentisphaerota bacterium]
MKNPVILQTDIGTDFDDNWALTMLLCQQNIDLKMVLVDTGNLRYRASVAAKVLNSFSRSDVEIGLGVGDDNGDWDYSLAGCVSDDDLKSYPGRFSENGVERLIEIVMSSCETVTIISIGPCSGIARALELEPRLAQKCRFSGMFGSIAFAHEGKPGAIAEYNVVCDIPAAQKVFSSPWQQALLTPLDSCGRVRLRGENFKKVFSSEKPYLKLLMQQYALWHEHIFNRPMPDFSSVLFDTVAVHLAQSTQFLEMKKMRLIVDDDGFTREDPSGMPFDVAVNWQNLAAFESYLVSVLIGK